MKNFKKSAPLSLKRNGGFYGERRAGTG